MSNESFDVNFTDVPLINQLTNMSCWAASAAMVVGWRDRLSIDPAAIAAGTGIWSAYTNGLAPGDIPSLATAWGLTVEPPPPGHAGAYAITHDIGSQYVLTLQQFAQEYETPATYPNVSVQILHAEGRS
jgi:hypothetical protein